MKKITYIYLLLATVLAFGCEKPRIVFDGEPVIEFKPIVATLNKGTDAAPGVVELKLQLVGPQRSSDVKITYKIDAASTAVAGTHYVALSGTANLLANTSAISIPVTAIPAGFPAGTTPKTLILILDDGTVKASPNYKKATITIR